MDSLLLVVILGAALAGFVQGLSGSNFGLVAMAVWAWVLDPTKKGDCYLMWKIPAMAFKAVLPSA